jgi:hypothetical protein
MSVAVVIVFCWLERNKRDKVRKCPARARDLCKSRTFSPPIRVGGVFEWIQTFDMARSSVGVWGTLFHAAS